MQIKEPVVTKLTQQEKEKMKNITPTTLKMANFSDDEDEKVKMQLKYIYLIL